MFGGFNQKNKRKPLPPFWGIQQIRPAAPRILTKRHATRASRHQARRSPDGSEAHHGGPGLPQAEERQVPQPQAPPRDPRHEKHGRGWDAVGEGGSWGVKPWAERAIAGETRFQLAISWTLKDEVVLQRMQFFLLPLVLCGLVAWFAIYWLHRIGLLCRLGGLLPKHKQFQVPGR